MRFRFLFLIFGLQSILINAQTNELIDSLKNGVATHTGLERIPFLDELAWQTIRIDADEAISYARKALSLAEASKDSVEVSKAANTLGACLLQSGQYQEAQKNNRRALNIRRVSGSQRDIGSSLSKIGLSFQYQSQLDSAIPYQIEALQYFEQAMDSGAIAQTYTNLANLFDNNKDTNKAIEYSEKARLICEQISFDYGLAGALGNLSMLWDKKGNYEKSIEYGEQALELFEKINARSDLANQLNNLGFYERKKGNNQFALERYKEAFSISDAAGDKYGKAKYRANIAATLVTLGEYEEAIALYEQSLKEARELSIYNVIWQCEEGFSNAYEGLGRHAEALEHFKVFKAIQDSVFSLEKNELIQELEIQYETEKKEKENLELVRKNQIIALENQRNRSFLFGLIALIVLIIISGIYYSNRQKARQKSRLQDEIIQERERGLSAIIQATEEERKRIARELHDGIGQQLSGLKLAWQKLIGDLRPKAEEESERLEKLSSILDDACVDVRTISHQMMPRALGEMGLVPAIQDMLEKSLGESDIRYNFEHFQVDGRFKESIEIGLYRIAQELVNNVIKHSGADQVYIQLFRNKKLLVMIVEDNGKGFKQGKNAQGIGLMNISSRINSVHGEVNYEPSPASGTVATIRIPIE